VFVPPQEITHYGSSSQDNDGKEKHNSEDVSLSRFCAYDLYIVIVIIVIIVVIVVIVINVITIKINYFLFVII
jgi:uncharacterized integral membrane protein